MLYISEDIFPRVCTFYILVEIRTISFNLSSTLYIYFNPYPDIVWSITGKLELQGWLSYRTIIVTLSFKSSDGAKSVTIYISFLASNNSSRTSIILLKSLIAGTILLVVLKMSWYFTSVLELSSGTLNVNTLHCTVV